MATRSAPLLGLSLLLLLVDTVDAAILTTEAEVTTTVQELIGGEPASASLDEEQLEPDRVGFPLGASSELVSTDLEGRVASFGSAISDLLDPARLAEANPAEFGLEVSCFSNLPSTAYIVRSVGVERRTLVFSSSSGVDSFPIQFNADGTRTIESEIFFGGAMIFWSTDPGPSFEGFRGELSVIVGRDAEVNPLFVAEMIVEGDPFAEPTPSSEGPIIFAIGGIELLTDGIDQSAIDALEELDAVASVAVVLVPFQSYTYTYTVREEQEFELTAGFEARVQNVPEGTGVAAAWGRDFAHLAGLLEDALPEINGAAVQASINKAMNRPPESLQNDAASAQSNARGTLCGIFGPAALVLLSVLFLMKLRVTRRV
ncbi:MAG: hypothetical protein JSV78_00955 [Phycisphaerales bacterium]|nr:MAG: hypothetical protein JSV78_00955 [Phycisphaerales bacterium]